MQVVIDLPDRIHFGVEKGFCVNGSDASQIVLDAVKNGTSLPKEYGRLIDADEVVKDICVEYKANSIYELSDELRSFIKKYLNEPPTILKPTIEYMIKNYAFFRKEQ